MPTTNAGKIDFSVDRGNLYREENITDLTTASIRQLTPIKIDGSVDDTRSTLYVGYTQLMSPQGPLPVQCELEAANLEAAIEQFPAAMDRELAKLISQAEKMQQEQKADESRIIVPGR